jgi:uncharacterized protein (TIGR03083 family)
MTPACPPGEPDGTAYAQGMNDHERHCVEAEAEIARFAAVTREADPATPVPTCPGWTIADLVRHHGKTLRWMAHIVRTLPAERVRSLDLDLGLPGDVAAYPAWFAEGAGPLMTALREAGGDTPVWTFGPDRHVRFWSRRVLHETLIHRADAELALGRTPEIPAELAVDGIEEFLTNAPSLRGFGHAGEMVHLHTTDHVADVLVRLGTDGVTWEHARGHGDAAVAGASRDLLLLVYGRLPLDRRFTVFGDRELLSGWLAASAW